MDDGRPGSDALGLGATVAAVVDPGARTLAASGPAPGPVGAAQALPLVDAAHYEVLAEHARGGLGRIIRARDRRTGRIVAIKEMLGDNDDAARRFAQEAMITANLQHPAIVPVYELGRWPTGAPFYAMKLVAGTSFEEAVRATPGADLRARLARLPVIVSVAEALAYAHARGVIHRDLKPANVLVGAYGETVVIDWGLAKRVDAADASAAESATALAALRGDAGADATVVGAVMGTPAYMPPEQALGEAVDERADVYAIGAMLYFVIAGAAPFADRRPASLPDLLALVAREAPTPIATLAPAAPPDLVAIVTKAMARDPAQRYRSAQELADDLRRFTTGQLVSAHRYDLRTLLRRWLQRHRAAVLVAVVLCGVLIVGGALSVQRILAERQAAQLETREAQRHLATALVQKGRVAEDAQQWARAAMYYAASRLHHDSAEARWAAGFAEARAVFPTARHTGHEHRWVHAAAIAPDGERIATVDDAGELRVWAPRTGAVIAHRALSRQALYAVTFRADGELAVGGDEGVIWRLGPDLATRAELRGHAGRVWSLAYGPRGGLASGGEDGTVRWWSLVDGTHHAHHAHTQRVYSVAVSPDGADVISASDDRTARRWRLAPDEVSLLGAHVGGGIRVAMFTPGGDQVITTGWDTEIHMWRVGAAAAVETWAANASVHGAAISPDGAFLVTGGDGQTIDVWEISTRQRITTLDARGGQTSAVAFSADGRWLVTAGQTGEPIVWDAGALHRLAAVGHRFPIDRVAYSASGRRFVTGSNADHTVRMWDAATGHELAHIGTGVACGDGAVAIGDDGIASACADATLRRWDLSGREVARLDTGVWLRMTAISPDGALLAAGHMGGELALVDVATWSILVRKTLHAHQIYGVQLTADDHLLTTALDSHTKLWRGRDLALELDVDLSAHDGLLSAARAPDGSQIASGAEDGTLAVWDVRAGGWFDHGRGARLDKTGTVWRIAYAPDGAHAFTLADGVVRVWDTRTWQVPTGADVLDGEEGGALGLAVSPDGATLIVGYSDGALVMWDVARRAVRTRIGGPSREHGGCAQRASAAWVDDAQRDIVAASCDLAPEVYAQRLATRTQQRIDNELDAHWQWEPVTPPDAE